MDFVARRKAGTGADAYIVTALLADWVSSEQTSQQMFGTWGYYLSAKYMSEMAALIGRTEDAATYGTLAQNIKTAYNNRFFNTTLHRYTAAGNGGTTGATQAAQAIALDAGLVPEGERGSDPAGAGGQHLRLPAVRRRPALQRRPRRPRPGRALADGGRSLGRAVGRDAGEHAAELRLHAAADHRASGGHDDDARALDARRLAEPRDPAADRGVVPHRRRRHQAGAELDRLPRPDLSSRPRSATSPTPRATTPPRRARPAASGAATRPASPASTSPSRPTPRRPSTSRPRARRRRSWPPAAATPATCATRTATRSTTSRRAT